MLHTISESRSARTVCILGGVGFCHIAYPDHALIKVCISTSSGYVAYHIQIMQRKKGMHCRRCRILPYNIPGSRINHVVVVGDELF